MSEMDTVKVSYIPEEFCEGNASEVTRVVKYSAGEAYELVSLVGGVATYEAPTSENNVDSRVVRNSMIAMLGASNYRSKYPSSLKHLFVVDVTKWQPPVVAPEPPRTECPARPAEWPHQLDWPPVRPPAWPPGIQWPPEGMPVEQLIEVSIKNNSIRWEEFYRDRYQ